MSALDILSAATLSRKTVTMCMDGALWAEWETLNESLGDIDPNKGSLAQDDVLETVDRMEAIRDRVKASEVTFLFEGLGPWGEIALRAEHPPRDKNPIDQVRGFNIETYFAALVQASCKSVTKPGSDEPEEIPPEVWATLLGKPATDDQPAIRGSLNTKQADNLIAAARYVNEGEIVPPPSARSLLESQDFGASLAQPSPGMSAPDGSEDGNRPSSPSTSTKKKARTKGDSSAL